VPPRRVAGTCRSQTAIALPTSTTSVVISGPGQFARPNPQKSDECGTIRAWLGHPVRVRAEARRDAHWTLGALDTPGIVNLGSDSPKIERSSRLDRVPRCGRIADGAEQQSGP